MLVNIAMAFAIALFPQTKPGQPGSGTSRDLEILKSAQKANGARYPSGELQATLKTGQLGDRPQHDYVECHTIWSGERNWTAVTRWPKHTHSEDLKQGEGIRQEWIVDATKATVFHPGGKRVVISPISRREPPLETRLTPQRCWYGPLGMSGRTWLDFLDPTRIPGVDASVFTFETSRESPDLIKVVRRDSVKGGSIAMLFSLTHDGNVIEYHFEEPGSEFESDGTCEWSRDSLGNLYLKKQKVVMKIGHENKKFEQHYDYEVSRFNSELRVNSSRFDMNSFKLDKGVVINDELTGRNRRVGDAPVQSVVDQLGPLIETMRARGFAADKPR